MPQRPFQLARYFTITSLVAFIVLGVALVLLQRGEERYFEGVQQQHNTAAARVQADLLKEQREAGRASLVAVHEAGHTTLAKVFANALWRSHFAPLVAQAQSLPEASCRGAGDARQACEARMRGRVTALPAFRSVDAPVRALMRGTSVFKIKVYDLRGLTVYSSEAAQVGEDKSDNAGWRSAVEGRPASELVHRNQFSAFEGVVKDRDLIQSYVPVAGPDGAVAGVLEIYSDVTPLFQQLRADTARAAAISVREQARMAQAAGQNQGEMEAASRRFLWILMGLLLVTFIALLLFARRGQGLIDREAGAREQAARREQAWHRDKMATLGAMAANISHEVGNPLANISRLAQEIGRWREARDIQPEYPRLIVEQAARIAEMTRRMNAFARAGRDRPQPLDANELVRTVCDFLAHDKRFRGTPIELRLAGGLPQCHGVPDHLNEVLMGLLQAVEESCSHCKESGGQIGVETSYLEARVTIRITGYCAGMGRCELPRDDPRIDSARGRMAEIGGSLEFAGPALDLRLPCALPGGGAPTAPAALSA